ncbi:MAG: hypothetical protein H0V84_07785 [Actinobacteria bacterium]|nr:hypothetical protein [Actinomycetota bacterium]
MSRAVWAVAAAALLLGTATGCGERSEPVGAHVSPYPVTVHGAGEDATVLRARPRRIVPLSAGAAELISDLGGRNQLVAGRAGSTAIWKLSGAELVRAVSRLSPDLVVASPSTAPLVLRRIKREARVPVYVTPDRSLRDVGRALTQLGLLTDHAVQARRLARANDLAGQRVVREVRGRPVLRVFLDTGFFTTVSTRTLFSDLLRLAGARNVVGPRPEPGPFSLRLLQRLDPQVYLATADSETTLRYLRRNPSTRKLSAVRSGRFRLVDPGYLVADGQLGPRVAALARLLHPDAGR